MTKVNLNKSNLIEFKTLTKNSRKGFITVMHVEDDICHVDIDNGAGTESKLSLKLSEVVRTYDARNWTPVPSTIDNDEEHFDTTEYDEAYSLKQEDDIKTVESFNALEEEEDKEIVLEVELENKRVITSRGSYVLPSKSEMFSLMADLGCTPAEISKMCNAHYSFVFGVLKRKGFTGDNCNKSSRPTKSQRMIELYEKGMTAREIATELEAHPSHVYSVLNKYKKGL